MASKELEAFIDESIRLSVERGYVPTVFIAMRSQHGTVGAITKLVEKAEIQTGFKRLISLGLLDWSIEAAVLRFPTEFSKIAYARAEFRLGLARGKR